MDVASDFFPLVGSSDESAIRALNRSFDLNLTLRHEVNGVRSQWPEDMDTVSVSGAALLAAIESIQDPMSRHGFNREVAALGGKRLTRVDKFTARIEFPHLAGEQ